MLDVYSYSEHPKVVEACEYIVDSIFKPRKDRRKYWKAVRMLITNLWISATASNNPWRSFSRDRTAYQHGTRYNQIYISFLVVSIVDVLIKLGYIEQINFKYNRWTGYGRSSRIRATDKLLELVRIRDIYTVLGENPEDTSEVVFLRDGQKKLIDYKDNGRTNEVRESLRKINKLLFETNISVDRKALVNSNEVVILTNKKVHCVFNDSDFWVGGRIYGGFWQQIKREYRTTIKINNEPVTELDFKANHPSIIYRTSTGKDIPDDCYSVEGYDRAIVKSAFLMMINGNDSRSAARALIKHARDRLNKSITYRDAGLLIKSLEELHEPILPFLYDKGYGKTLQSIEGEIAMDILLSLLRESIACLPVHDSFLVACSNREKLRTTMISSYMKYLNQEPVIDMKY